MSNVFLKNATSSAITVAGYTVHYIDNTNAEIVEVETAGEPLPSIGDTVTFGNYPQATSTPESIEWKVLEVDTTNHKCLLIANKILDCQKYNSTSASVTWETCSLRTWLNGTFFNAAFDITEQGRIPLSHIENTNNPDYGTSGGNATDDYIFCLSIQEASNTVYFANDTARKALATQKAIDAGVSVSSSYAYWWLRSPGSNSSRASGVAYEGDIGNYVVSGAGVGVRPALWMYYSQTVRFKAFKYTFNGISYYYVIDSIHNAWVNDLSSIGYSEVPAVTLPTVTVLLTVGLSGQVQSVAANGNTGGLREWDSSSGDYNGNYIEFDNGSKYASIEYASGGGGWSSPVGIFEPTSVTVSGTDVVGAKNVSETSKNFGAIKIARCLSSTVTVVIVYNSSNNTFNAFKFTTNNTDYYYVLDKTQTDWTDDLAAAGYTEDSPEPPVVLPTVNTITIYTNSDNHYYQEHVTNTTTEVVASYTYDLYTDQSCMESFSYDSNSLYIVGRIVDGVWTKNSIQSVSDMPSNEASSLSNATVGRILLSNGKIWYVINAGISYYTMQWSGICKVCSSNQASVITVYNSSNVAYNAFKFTANNTDYYYVLDGAQTDWTNDLASIGYSLTPSVVLPTVNTTNNIYHRLRFNRSGGDYTFSARVTTSVYSDSPTNPTYVDWDSTKVYGVIKYYNSDQTFVGRQGITPIEAPSWGEAGKIYMENISGDSLTVSKIRVATCDDLFATVAIVYDSQNTSYNAFKYTTGNTDYYYVLDEVQTDWTDDLSSIGYSLIPAVVLPTVNSLNYGWYNRGSSDAGGYVASGASFILNDTSGNPLSYDTSVIYGVYKYYPARIGDGTLWAGFSALNDSNQIKLTNASDTGVTVQRVIYATCSDSSANVVTVYDSSNVAYNTFLYTASGTDYYYVLDGVQSDWIDDLSSIGYSELITSYFRPDKDFQTLQTYNNLYDDNGNRIPYQVGKVYTLQTLIGTGNYLINVDGWLQFHYNSSVATSAKYVKYTVS